MGSNRKIHSNESETKIQKLIAFEYGINGNELYDVWKTYVIKKIDKDKNIVEYLRNTPSKFNQKAVDYFTTVGLELFSAEYVKNFTMEIDKQYKLAL